MKKRKIRYDRILLPILILCVIIFGISSCHKTEETKVQSKPIHTTTDFLKNGTTSRKRTHKIDKF